MRSQKEEIKKFNRESEYLRNKAIKALERKGVRNMEEERKLDTLFFTTMVGYLIAVVQQNKMSTITELIEYLNKQMDEYNKALEK